ncbi:hypothetical protein GIB67_042591 [Kingdonia uniflora]|uniref:Uncharacterized protein n=1 Tax=Kingdonia uniflora TaxID=39325 RepID=A0A7J7M1B2_9MAGN|nr:hypothetical protein GIB67_042591 [Kingdonia uniflora]
MKGEYFCWHLSRDVISLFGSYECVNYRSPRSWNISFPRRFLFPRVIFSFPLVIIYLFFA